jgi:hypothetical protein
MYGLDMVLAMHAPDGFLNPGTAVGAAVLSMGLVDARQGVVQDGPITPVAVHARHLPDVLDARDVAPE